MAQSPDNIGALAVLGGQIYVGTSTSVIPTTATSTLPNTWSTMGRFGEDGLTVSRTRNTATVKDQNGEIVFDTVTEAGITFKAKFIEAIKAVIENYYGTTVTNDGTQTVVPGAQAPRAPFVFDTVLADEAGNRWVERQYVAIGQVTETADQTLKKGDALGYDMTIRAYPSATIKDPGTGQDGSVRIFRTKVTTP